MTIWPQWFYQYGVGGLFFLAAVIAALRTGAIRWSHPTERRLLLALLAGLFAFMSAHAAWIVLAVR
ncbi:MAG: hypothetical protein ACC628_19350 [Pirellulaceae bacterium]